MRVLLAAALLPVTAAPPVAAAQTPMTLLLASAHGRGSVTVSAPTKQLHGRIWLYRQGGAGAAHGKVTLACRGTMTAEGKSYSYQWSRFTIAPNARTEVWRHAGDEPCTLTVSLTGKGLLTVALRGY